LYHLLRTMLAWIVACRLCGQALVFPALCPRSVSVAVSDWHIQ
jgi:hypothetical protein